VKLGRCQKTEELLRNFLLPFELLLTREQFPFQLEQNLTLSTPSYPLNGAVTLNITTFGISTLSLI
jgi:hypothetical protein